MISIRRTGDGFHPGLFITEQLKAEQPMLWVRKMNGIRTAAERMVLTEIVYGGRSERGV